MGKEEKELHDFERVMELESRKLATDVNREEIIKMQKEVGRNNDVIALKIKEQLKENNIVSFDIVGAIGAGKTAILERICDALAATKRVLVICGDITTRVDADRIQKTNVDTIQINTGRECALNAYHIHKIIHNTDLENFDVIFIENVGNLICPAEFGLGMNKRITVVSVTEGEWVVEKHPLLFKISEIAVINKIDLAERLNTNINKMVTDAKKINPEIKVVQTSARTGEGIDKLMRVMGLK